MYLLQPPQLHPLSVLQQAQAVKAPHWLACTSLAQSGQVPLDLIRPVPRLESDVPDAVQARHQLKTAQDRGIEVWASWGSAGAVRQVLASLFQDAVC